MRRPWLVATLLVAGFACSSDTPTFTATDPSNPRVEISRDDLATYCAAVQDADRVLRDAAALGIELAALRLQSDTQQLEELAADLEGPTQERVAAVASSVKGFADTAARQEPYLTPENLSAFSAAIGFMPGCGGT